MWAQKAMVYISTTGTFCFLLLVNISISVVRLLSPGLAKSIVMRLGEQSTMAQNPNFKYEDWGLTFGSMNFVKAVSHSMWLSLGQEAFQGGEAPDSPVVLLSGAKSSIGKFVRGAWRGPFCVSPCSHLTADDSRHAVCLCLCAQVTDLWC